MRVKCREALSIANETVSIMKADWADRERQVKEVSLHERGRTVYASEILPVTEDFNVLGVSWWIQDREWAVNVGVSGKGCAVGPEGRVRVSDEGWILDY